MCLYKHFQFELTMTQRQKDIKATEVYFKTKLVDSNGKGILYDKTFLLMNLQKTLVPPNDAQEIIKKYTKPNIKDKITVSYNRNTENFSVLYDLENVIPEVKAVYMEIADFLNNFDPAKCLSMFDKLKTVIETNCKCRLYYETLIEKLHDISINEENKEIIEVVSKLKTNFKASNLELNDLLVHLRLIARENSISSSLVKCHTNTLNSAVADLQSLKKILTILKRKLEMPETDKSDPIRCQDISEPSYIISKKDNVRSMASHVKLAYVESNKKYGSGNLGEHNEKIFKTNECGRKLEMPENIKSDQIRHEDIRKPSSMIKNDKMKYDRIELKHIESYKGYIQSAKPRKQEEEKPSSISKKEKQNNVIEKLDILKSNKGRESKYDMTLTSHEKADSVLKLSTPYKAKADLSYEVNNLNKKLKSVKIRNSRLESKLRRYKKVQLPLNNVIRSLKIKQKENEKDRKIENLQLKVDALEKENRKLEQENKLLQNIYPLLSDKENTSAFENRCKKIDKSFIYFDAKYVKLNSRLIRWHSLDNIKDCYQKNSSTQEYNKYNECIQSVLNEYIETIPKIVNLKHKNAKLQSDILLIETKLKTALMEKSELNLTLNNIQAQIQQLEKELEAAKIGREDFERKYQPSKETLAEIYSKHQEICQEYENKLKKERELLSLQEALYEESLKNLQNKYDSLVCDLAIQVKKGKAFINIILTNLGASGNLSSNYSVRLQNLQMMLACQVYKGLPGSHQLC